MNVHKFVHIVFIVCSVLLNESNYGGGLGSRGKSAGNIRWGAFYSKFIKNGLANDGQYHGVQHIQ